MEPNATQPITPAPVVAPAQRRSWALMRQFMYGAVLLLMVVGISYGVYTKFIYHAPTCTDGAQNGDEHGVDCGGVCTTACLPDVIPPTIQWARAFAVGTQLYHAVAYVANPNKTVGTRALGYTLTLEDTQGVIATRSGITALPPDGVYPIFEGRIETGGRMPTLVRVTFDVASASWTLLTTGRTDYTVISRELSGAGSAFPKLTAHVQNNLYTETSNLRVVTVVYDSAREPLAVSQTVIPRIAAREQADVVFTWSQPIAGTVKSCVVPTDVALLIDRSGSMIADGGIPPEPLESAKKAAEVFAASLKERDQVGVISYATTPAIDQELSNNHFTARDTVLNLAAHTDGVQYTDLSAAFATATAMLTGARHNPDARQVLVLMTDGDVTRPLNPVTGQRDNIFAENQARAAADAAKRAGISLYTIGFGSAFVGTSTDTMRNLSLVRELATDSAHSFVAPTSDELANVYTTISQGLCEAGPAIIDVIPVPDYTR